MTPQGLNELKGLESEVKELRDRAEDFMVYITDLSKYYEKVKNLEAYGRLAKATASLQISEWQLGRAVKEIRKAHELEKAQMDFFKELQNKLHNDKAKIYNN